ncbi:TonB-dependent receptor [Paludibaculum fermentans]|uniref:TonB-dependent receptor n=1 Tax=Paludibaculum fermentans TaxID=1473598 RepID=A0A7S7NKY0_PALFE|nr:TonB-dependent receptor [Paludibaculum fermentans]QOY85563.1 TonB-dependent receptor [Paludibaculum fermentans]
MGCSCVSRYILITFALVFMCVGQQDRATLTGRVSDSSGASVKGVELKIESATTNAVYESRTNEEGLFTVPNLPAGAYRLAFRGSGFKTLIREQVVLNAAQVVRIDAQMQLGTLTESVDVTAETPLLQTDAPDVGTVLNHQKLTGLPLSFSGGRYAENFAYKLTPGVGGNNYESRINGSAAFSKAVVLDGADATIYIGGQFGESSPSLEAFEELKVQTSGMSAEFGRTGGGVFNFVMKSGANQMHGSAVGFLHNEWMDANSFVNNYYGRPRQRDRRNDWGGSLGGPVVLPGLYKGKDKTFFYLAYERYKESYAGGGSPTVTVPLDEFWNGNLSRLMTGTVLGQDAQGRNVNQGAIYDPASTRTVNGQVVRDVFAGNLIPQSRISGPAQKLGAIFRQHYSPTVKSADGQVPLLNNSFFPVSNQAGFTQNQFSVKLDHYLSAAHKLSGSFSYIDRPRTILDQGGVWDFNDPSGGPLSRARLQWVRSWYGRLAYDWTLSPSVLNHLQLGFNRQRNPSVSAHLGENGVAALGLTGLSKEFNYSEIQFGSNNYPANYPALGFQTNDFGAGQNFQVIDTVSWVRNRHTVRAGADWRRSYLRWRTDNGPAAINFSQAQTGLPGYTQTGNGFASMLLGEVASATVPTPTPTGSRFTNFALFLQDDFRATSRLTLNLGVRWDYQPLPVEQYNRLGNWNPGVVDPAWGLPGALEFASADRRTFAPNHYTDFSPRIGFAYQVNARTTVRGAYGIFYLARNGNGWSGVPWAQTAGFGQENRVSTTVDYQAAWNWNNPYPGVNRPLPQNASLANGSPGIWGIVSYDPNAGKNGYTQQWNLNIQRELGAGIVVDAGYVGSKSTGIQANELRRLNQLNPRFLALGDALGVTVSSQAELPASVAAAGGRYPFLDAGIRVPAYQTLLPYPQMLGTNEIKSADSPLGFSTYHALQVQVNKRYSGGLSFLWNYTFSKSIDNVRSAFGDTWGANSGRPLDYYNQRLDKSVSDADRSHVFKTAVQYELPFGRGRRFGKTLPAALDLLAGGWTLHYIGTYNSGWALGVSGSGTPNSNFATNRGYALNPGGLPLATGWDAGQLDMSRISQPNSANRYVNTPLFVNPTTLGRYQRGNTSYKLSQLRSPWEMSEDLAVQKGFRPVEAVRVQLRGEVLNAFNRTLWGTINVNTASPLFGQVTGTSDWFTPRKIQLGLRADW